MNTEDFTKALAECIHQAQCAVVDPMAHAEIWKDELIKLAKSEEPVSEEWVEELRAKLDSLSKEDFKKVFDKYAVDFNEEPVSEDLEKELSRLLKDCEIDSEYIHQDFLHIVANHFADWQKERIKANSTNATIGLPYENKYGGYTHLIDVSRPLPIGSNKIAIIFKED